MGDFDALLEEENVVIPSPSPVKSDQLEASIILTDQLESSSVKSEDNESKPEVSASDKSDINNGDGGLETCVNNNADIMTEGNNNCVEETDTDVCTNTLGEVTAPDTEST